MCIDAGPARKTSHTIYLTCDCSPNAVTMSVIRGKEEITESAMVWTPDPDQLVVCRYCGRKYQPQIVRKEFIHRPYMRTSLCSYEGSLSVDGEVYNVRSLRKETGDANEERAADTAFNHD